ncbi:hypothetical protein [Bacillus sp. JCM 19041]|uniref:hypothetical protein n=1 Tax=Bacillus sp. JCM 19041 TaxID=1460637 RepID=UPI0006D1C7BC
MDSKAVSTRKVSLIRYAALIIGIACFFLTFVPFTRIALVGSMFGDYIIYALTAIGVTLSIYSILKSQNKIVPIVSLIFSLSLPIFLLLLIVLLFTGTIDFAP